MKIKSQIDINSFIKLNFNLVYRKPITIILTFIGTVILIACFLQFIGRPLPGEFSLYGFIFAVFVVFILPIYTYINAKKNYEKNTKLQEIIEYQFNEESYITTGESFTSTQSWGSVFKIKELRNWVLIYQTSVIFNPIPKSAFGDKIDEFRKIMKKRNNANL